MTAQEVLAALEARTNPGKATEMAAYHKAPRCYLGVANPTLDAMVREWRQALDLDSRLTLARDLWEMDIHETRVAAAKLLTQARIRPDDSAVWALIQSWVPQFDAWAIADHAAIAGQKRLIAAPRRLDDLEPWVASDHLWTARSALVMTLPWARMRHPKPADLEVRERVLTWAVALLDRPGWFAHKAVAWWLRDLSRKDPDRTAAFLADHGSRMRAFAQREAARHLPEA